MARRFEVWLAKDGQEPVGAPELYQVLVLCVALPWTLLIGRAPLGWFASLPIRIAGLVLVLYLVAEVLVFALHWALATDGPITNPRRSLATFFVSLLEVATLMSIAIGLAGCDTDQLDRFHSLWRHVSGVFQLESPATDARITCRALAHSQSVVAGTVLLIAVANLVGAISRPPTAKSSSEAGAG